MREHNNRAFGFMVDLKVGYYDEHVLQQHLAAKFHPCVVRNFKNNFSILWKTTTIVPLVS